MDVSVVIPTYNRPLLLRRCLEALAAQTYSRDRFEVVVVEDGGPGSAAQVIDALRERSSSPAIHYVPVPRGGPGAARNVGWRVARGRVIAFTDDDTVPDPAWLEEGARTVEAGIGAVSGRTVVPLSNQPTDAERNVQRLETAQFATCNVFCSRQALEAVGGFDIRFTRAYREDSDLQFSLLEAGYTVLRNEAAVVCHPPRQERPFVSLGQQRNQYFDALLYRKHPDYFRTRIRARPPWRYYAIAAAQLATLVALLTGRRRAAALISSVWLSLAGAFCRERLQGSNRSPRHVLDMAVTSLLIPVVAVYWRLRGAWAFRVVFW